MIYIGSDHAGYDLKQDIKKFLERKKIPYQDMSQFYNPSDDYPDIAKAVAKAVKKKKAHRGILICGSSIGMAIAANRIKGIRAAPVFDDYSSRTSRLDNDANVVCLRARNFPRKRSLKLLSVFLNTPFSYAERHIRRIKKVDRLR